MQKLDPRSYPLIQIRDIAKLYNWMERIVEVESAAIKDMNEVGYMIHLGALASRDFYFVIESSCQAGDKVLYRGDYAPASEFDRESNRFELVREELMDQFGEWISIVKQYDAIRLTTDEMLLKAYEEEYYQTFEFRDENAEREPLDEARQFLLLSCLEGVETGLKKTNHKGPEIDALLSETMDLKNNIQNLTKGAAARRLSRLMARIRKISLSLLREIGKEIEKELIKEGLKIVYQGVGHLLTNLHLLR